MATAKQIAWRKKFAALAKSGAFAKKRRRKNPAAGARSEVRSPTSTRTSTEAETRGNVTVTGGAGRGANTTVRVTQGRKNPVKRKGVSAKKYVSRPSQATGTAPTKRLKARRKANRVGSGAFPNPIRKRKLATRSMPFEVQRLTSGAYRTVAKFATQREAVEYARAKANQENVAYAIKDTGRK